MDHLSNSLKGSNNFCKTSASCCLALAHEHTRYKRRFQDFRAEVLLETKTMSCQDPSQQHAVNCVLVACSFTKNWGSNEWNSSRCFSDSFKKAKRFRLAGRIWLTWRTFDRTPKKFCNQTANILNHFTEVKRKTSILYAPKLSCCQFKVDQTSISDMSTLVFFIHVQ